MDKLHIIDNTFGAVYHCNTVTRSYRWISCCVVDVTHATRSDNRELGAHGECLIGVEIEDISTEAGCASCVLGHKFAEVVLCEQVDGEVMFEYCDVGVCSCTLDKSTLYLGTCEVFVVENTMLGVSALTMQLILAIGRFVEVCAPLYKVGYQLRSATHYQLYGL